MPLAGDRGRVGVRVPGLQGERAAPVQTDRGDRAAAVRSCGSARDPAPPRSRLARPDRIGHRRGLHPSHPVDRDAGAPAVGSRPRHLADGRAVRMPPARSGQSDLSIQLSLARLQQGGRRAGCRIVSARRRAGAGNDGPPDGDAPVPGAGRGASGVRGPDRP